MILTLGEVHIDYMENQIGLLQVKKNHAPSHAVRLYKHLWGEMGRSKKLTEFEHGVIAGWHCL